MNKMWGRKGGKRCGDTEYMVCALLLPLFFLFFLFVLLSLLSHSWHEGKMKNGVLTVVCSEEEEAWERYGKIWSNKVSGLA